MRKIFSVKKAIGENKCFGERKKKCRVGICFFSVNFFLMKNVFWWKKEFSEEEEKIVIFFCKFCVVVGENEIFINKKFFGKQISNVVSFW